MRDDEVVDKHDVGKPQGRARGAADGPQPYQTRPEPRQRACSSGQGL